MRVLSLGNMYPPQHLGGYELVWQSATRALRAAGHQVRVLTTDTRRPGAPADEQDADVHRELRWYWRDHGWPRLGFRERLRLERANAATFDRHVAELRPDAVAWWALGGMSLSLVERARRRGLPAVGMVHDDWLVYGPQEDQWLRACRRLGPAAELVGRLAGVPASVDLGRGARWLFVSEATRERAERLGGLDLADARIAHSGIDHRFVGADTPPRAWRWRMLSVGRLDPRKGVDTAIRALAALPAEATLDVAGDGEQDVRDRLAALSAELGLADRVRFLGQRTREELRDTYGDADLVVFPVRWDEPWGLVPLEAMALGRPVVATGRGGSAEYLRDGKNCLLFAADDATALATAVRRLAGDEALRERVRRGGLDTAPRHTDTVFNQAVEAALADVAGAGEAGAQRRRSSRNGRSIAQ